MTQIQEPTSLAKVDTIRKQLVDLLNAPVKLIINNNLHSLISVKWQASGFVFRLHHMFLDAHDTVLAALARWAAGPRKQANRTLRAFIDQHEQKIIRPAKPARPRKIKLTTQGCFFDLTEATLRIQHEYFNVEHHIPITWGPSRKKPGRRQIRLGSYSSQSKLIRINPLLDQAFVPQFVLDDIIFHEILHYYLGSNRKDGRTRVHHGTFKKLEKEHRHHQAAQAWIKENLSRLVRKDRVQGVKGLRQSMKSEG
jgi:predicted SprT family Zn-dependent metalloprotease